MLEKNCSLIYDASRSLIGGTLIAPRLVGYLYTVGGVACNCRLSRGVLRLRVAVSTRPLLGQIFNGRIAGCRRR